MPGWSTVKSGLFELVAFTGLFYILLVFVMKG